jgi:predicted nucleic acid-binding protein
VGPRPRQSLQPSGRVATAPDSVIVVDSSAVLAALIARPAPRGLIERIAHDGDLHAPHLIDIEVLHALRRLSARGELSDERVADARSDFRELVLVRYPHVELSDRIWEMRHNLTAYDAAFIALAEVLGAPLITCDSALGRVPGHSARIEVFPA